VSEPKSESELNQSVPLQQSWPVALLYQVSAEIALWGVRAPAQFAAAVPLALEVHDVRLPPRFTDPKTGMACALLMPQTWLPPISIPVNTGTKQVPIIVVKLLTHDECLRSRNDGPAARKELAKAGFRSTLGKDGFGPNHADVAKAAITAVNAVKTYPDLMKVIEGAMKIWTAAAAMQTTQFWNAGHLPTQTAVGLGRPALGGFGDIGGVWGTTMAPTAATLANSAIKGADLLPTATNLATAVPTSATLVTPQVQETPTPKLSDLAPLSFSDEYKPSVPTSAITTAFVDAVSCVCRRPQVELAAD
jgi:hypothetical protein